MSKDNYKRVVEVDTVSIGSTIQLKVDTDRVRRAIQRRVDEGWTYRGLGGVINAAGPDSPARTIFLVFQRKEIGQ